jgi:HEAT repeat protein
MLLRRARPTTVEALVRDLRAADPKTRVHAADEAARVAETDLAARETVVDALVRALSDEDADVRAATALALADLRGAEALAALTVAADDDVPLVRQLAISALGEIGDPRARERVRRALSDERPEVRFQAIVAFPRLLRHAGEEGADDRREAWVALESGLNDDDAQVRGRASEACAELADGAALPESVADRLARIADDAEETADTRVAAAIALAESGDRRGGKVIVAVLRGAIEEPNPGRVQAAFELAGELGLEEAREACEAAAFGVRAWFGDPGKRTAALVALVRLGDARAIEHVLGELSSRSWSRRALAIGVVGRAGMQQARGALEAMRGQPSVIDPEALEDALARIADDARTGGGT